MNITLSIRNQIECRDKAFGSSRATLDAFLKNLGNDLKYTYF